MSLPMLIDPNNLKSLDTSGIAGFFGGNVAVRAMNTVHVYAWRRYLGWYNSPGSCEIAKAYGQVAKSKFWDALFPGPNHEPAVLFALDGKDGPPYMGAHSGTVLSKTGHAAHLIVQECKDPAHSPIPIPGRRLPSVPVSIVRLPSPPTIPRQLNLLRDQRRIDFLIALLPISSSAAAASACAYFRDWFCFAMIVLGMLASGISCLVIGSGTLVYPALTPAKGAPRGDGVLNECSGPVVLLGEEGAVNRVTRGAFALRYVDEVPQRDAPSASPGTRQTPPQLEDRYQGIGVCSLLLTTQFLAQLLIVPLGTLFGQLMFLSSLAVSWAYSSYLCSTDPWDAQRRILKEQVLGKPIITKFLLPTRTAVAVFVLMILADGQDKPENDILQDIFSGLLPNKTRVWQEWRKIVWPMIKDSTVTPVSADPAIQQTMSETQWRLLGDLVSDANAGARAFSRYRSNPEGLSPVPQAGGRGYRDSDPEAQQPAPSLSGCSSDTEHWDDKAGREWVPPSLGFRSGYSALASP